MSEPKSGTLLVVSAADELKKLITPAPAPKEPAPERSSTTEHEIVIDGQRVRYQAVAGSLPVALEDQDKPKGRMFYVAYTRLDTANAATRPLTFCFNGGPGSSSIWLHMGCLGPKRVAVDASGIPRPGAVALDNPQSLLDFTDLVFIDPVATGFSKAEDGPGHDYHGVNADMESVGEFIRRYVTRHTRWASPKYVIGESYGTTRAAVLAKHLQERRGMYLDGIILVSLALKFQTLMFHEGNDLPYVLYVPAYAATAAYHGVIPRDNLDRTLAEAERWAYDRYLPALVRGSSLKQSEQDQISEELAAIIGVSADFVKRCNNRVELGRFCRELLRHKRQVVGRLDSRFVGHDSDAQGERPETDPSYVAIYGAYASAFQHHLRTHLNYEDDDAYEVLNFKANEKWVWAHDNQYVDVASALRRSMLDNEHLRVFVASGWYDLATPVPAADYTIHQLGLEPHRRPAIEHHRYPAGHMMYLHEPTLAAMRRDLLAFYERRPTS
jgi:carboxypeptidase C (cathepsin A)